MASTIITMILAALISMQFAAKWRFYAFAIGTLVLYVPVRWVVFPVSAYLETVSAGQFFLDQKVVTLSCFGSVIAAPFTGKIDWPYFLPGIVAIAAIIVFVFQFISSMSQSHRAKAQLH